MAVFNIDTITAGVETGPQASRTDVDKAFLSAVTVDLAKGLFSSLGNTHPELHWDTSRRAFAWGQGGVTAPDIYMQRVSASLLEIKDAANSAYVGLSLKDLRIAGSTVIDASENLSLTGTGTSQKLGGVGAKVSIGGMSPQTTLDLFSIGVAGLRISDTEPSRSTGQVGSWLEFWSTENSLPGGSDVVGKIVPTVESVSGTDWGMGFWTQAGAGPVEYMRLDKVGRLGVNKLTALAAQLHVVSGVAGRVGLIVDTAANPSGDIVQFKQNGVEVIRFMGGGTRAEIIATTDFDNDAGVGSYIHLGRNNDGATPAGASIILRDKGGTNYYIHADDSGVLHVGTVAPINADDTTNPVVGDQSSWHETKNILGPALSVEDAVRDVAALVFEQFEYKGDTYQEWDGSRSLFNGLVVRDRKNDWWAKHCAPNQTPALNEIELFARYGLTIQSLIAEVKALGGFAWL